MTRAITTLSGAVGTVRDDIDTGGDRAMTAALAIETATWEEAVQSWQKLDLPNKAWRAEIIEGRVQMTPPPGTAHNLIAHFVHRAFLRAVSDEWGIFQTLGIAIPMRRTLCVPDIAIVPRDAVPDEEGSVSASKAALVAEITSIGNADDDRKKKLWAYAHAEVPLYLLIDRFGEEGPAVSLHSKPCGGRYLTHQSVPFGDPINIPEPFGLVLETKEF
ncbi:Uma2 family endonuclease [Saccharopolyspora shandongensis]|uniref:Uma2 family endonuclease n=1 Tax=Saccharopolyspora shandongensis TaxID=418495 RepID=UPI00342855A3